MKERPILFSAPMVRAILEGRKTQTRRVVKPQPNPHMETGSYRRQWTGHLLGTTKFDGKLCWQYGASWGSTPGDPVPVCPYGQPGDRLWVRETFEVLRETCSYESGDYDAFPWEEDMYGPAKDMLLDKCPRGGYRAVISYCADGEDVIERWKPSIFMPRWASRITLEVVSVRVERLDDISEEDAKAEGVPEAYKPPQITRMEAEGYEWCPYITEFRGVWEEINGPLSWDKNPWVWVVEFKKINP